MNTAKTSLFLYDNYLSNRAEFYGLHTNILVTVFCYFYSYIFSMYYCIYVFSQILASPLSLYKDLDHY